MTLDDLINKINALNKSAKAGILAAIVALVFGGYYYFFYGDMLDEQKQNENVINKMKKDKADYEQRKKEYLAYRNEINQLVEEQKEVLRVLPKRDPDIEQFIEN